MAEVRHAPYPSSTLAKGWRFEVNMEQVKKSDTWLRARTGMVRAHLLLLWAEAWEQTPCGSLPSDDELLALLLDMDGATFATHRAVLMRGWWLADDGRMYHDTITERVLAMIEKRMSDAQRAAARRARLAESSATPTEQRHESRVTPTELNSEFDTKHQAPVIPETGSKNPPKPPRKRRGKSADADLVSVEALVAEGVVEQHARDWLAVRAEKNCPLTRTALDGVKAQAAEAGLSLPDAIRTATENGWAGFKAKWMVEHAAPPARASPGGVNRQEAIEQRNQRAADEWLAMQGAPV